MGIKLSPFLLPDKYGVTSPHPTPCCLFGPGFNQSIQADHKNAEGYVHTKTRTWVFAVALFIRWKRAKYPSTKEGIAKYGISQQWNVIWL